MTKFEDKVARLEAELKEAKKQKLRHEAQKRAASATRTRKDDTRRKVLIGALVLDLWDKNKGYKAELIKELGSFLTRPNDRALFNLPGEKASGLPAANAVDET